jgi:signal transduction histidine kinase
MLQILGLRSFEEFAAHPQFKKLLPPTTMGQIEVKWPRSDDSRIIVRVNSRAIHSLDGSILYYEGIIEDITDRKRSEDLLRQAKLDLEGRVTERTAELRKANAELRRLTQKVVMAQEEERERLSRELHDEIGQALTAVNFNLQAFQHLVVDPMVASRLQDSMNIVESTLQQVRALSLDLHPAILDDLGLVAALQWYLDRQTERSGLTIDLVADPPKMNLPADLKTTCFRIVQEALTNTLRHAHAKKVQVELRQHDAELELVVRDDGAGFSVQAARQRAAHGESLGLLGMKERVLLLKGRIKIKSARGRGTEIRVRFPLFPVDLAKPRAGGRTRR